MQIQEGVLLSSYSTFKIGGPARYFAAVSSAEEIMEAITWAKERHLSYFLLGKGSNSLFDDRGFNGLVILNKFDYLTDLGDGRFEVGGGHSFAHLGVVTARAGYSGLEFASGIPGSVGGAVYMNAGANGLETKDCLEAVQLYDGSLFWEEASQLRFGYRFSEFHTSGAVIVAARFALKSSKEARAKQIEIVNYRTATQPYGQPSAGCMFRNPEGEGAGALIDRCGLKELRVGEAQVSEKHANFIVNRGGASASDVLQLAKQIKREVKAKTGIELEQEVRAIPYEART